MDWLLKLVQSIRSLSMAIWVAEIELNSWQLSDIQTKLLIEVDADLVRSVVLPSAGN
jgi:hypothetical protein